MLKADSAIWFVKFAITCLLLSAGCWAAPHVFKNLPQFPPATTDEEQVAIFERYFQLPVQDIVVVGSSLAYHLKEQFFERGNVRNAALPGGSPLTGLAIIATAPALRPPVIAVETNVLNRGIDNGLFQKFKDARRRDDMLRPLRTIAAYYQSAQDDVLTFDAARRQSILARAPATYDTERGIENALIEWNKPIYDAAMLNDATVLKSLVEKLEAQGVTIAFFEMPYPPKMHNTGYAVTARKILKQVFGDGNNRGLSLDYDASQLRWLDAAHLDDRSAIIFASALDNAIRKKMAIH
jgi:hypothetical protein